MNHPKNFILGQLNVNGLRSKFPEIHELLNHDTMNVLGLCETKIDSSFTSAQFHIDGYRLYRRDRNSRGGGVAMYVQSHLPHRRRLDLECDVIGIENIVLEVIMKKESFIIIHVYRPPDIPVASLVRAISLITDQCVHQCKTVFIIGDVNVDCKSEPNDLSALTDTLALTNVVKGPTCFKSLTNPSLIDVILTNTPNRIMAHLNENVDISDCHNLVCAATRIHAPNNAPRWITYRSYRRFDEESFKNDLSNAPLHVSASLMTRVIKSGSITQS